MKARSSRPRWRSDPARGVTMPALRASMRAVCAALFAMLVCVAALAQDKLPALTGRIVDNAALIAAPQRAALETKLAELETKSGIQFVIASVRSLDGYEIEPYANALFRAWKLGEKQRNNGVLLLVAPNERRVRIEVGYGLEGTLTDALAKVIIANAIAPRFKAGDFTGGIERGVDDVITVLTTDASEWQKRADLRAEPEPSFFEQILPILIFLIFVFVIVSVIRNTARGGRIVQRGGRVVTMPSGSWGSGTSSWGGGDSGSSGGFSGGGGSSGGGGASGSW